MSFSYQRCRQFSNDSDDDDCANETDRLLSHEEDNSLEEDSGDETSDDNDDSEQPEQTSEESFDSDESQGANDTLSDQENSTAATSSYNSPYKPQQSTPSIISRLQQMQWSPLQRLVPSPFYKLSRKQYQQQPLMIKKTNQIGPENRSCCHSVFKDMHRNEHRSKCKQCALEMQTPEKQSNVNDIEVMMRNGMKLAGSPMMWSPIQQSRHY